MFRRLLWSLIFVVLCSAPTMAESTLKGFDGLAWGTPLSAVKGETREELGGRILAVRNPLDKFKDTYSLSGAYKIYYICRDRGLCGGKLKLVFKKRLQATPVSRTLRNLKALLVDKYGPSPSGPYVSGATWTLSGGVISLVSGARKNYPFIEVLYRSKVYNETEFKAEQALSSKMKSMAESWNFRF